MLYNYNNRRKRMFFKNCCIAIVLALLICVFFTLSKNQTKYYNYALPANAWGLSFQSEGLVPVPNMSADELLTYNAYFYDTSGTKKIYLTFDCGYENGNTDSILDTLQKHGAPATFFVVGPYVKENTELLVRMVNEGHSVGSHTYNHPNVSELSYEDLALELSQLEDEFHSATGSELSKYLRPPEGKFSNESLQNTKDLGYSTIFWSLAYKDWIQDAQPTIEEAFSKLLPRIHDGAILLLHNTSATNAQILDELLTEIEKMGYNFAPLSELTNSAA